VRDFDGDLEDYAGWLEKRAGAAATPAAPKARNEGQPKRRRHNGEQRDLAPRRQEVKAIETSLAKLGQERTRLESDLATLDYGRDGAHARKVTEHHAAVLREIEQLETRWLELSERLESADG
jgi:ATP-binding cassette subfamily F protein 3